MEETDNREIELLQQAFRNLGASQDQSLVMARQLMKRAGQLAEERGTTREEALAYLLRLTSSGARCEPPPDFPGVD